MQHVSTIYARFIVRELQLEPAEIDALLQHCALNSNTLFELGSMDYADFFEFIVQVQKFSGDDQLGLKVGKKLAPMSAGELGSAILAAPNVLESFILASNFSRIHAGYFEMKLQANFSGLVVEYVELADLGETQRFQTEVMLLMMQNFIETIIGEPFTQGKYVLPYPRPTNGHCYDDYFNSPVSFSGTNARVEIPRKWVGTRSLFHDPLLWKSYQHKFMEQLTELMAFGDKPFTQQVNQWLSASPPPLPSASDTASVFHITERTLSRKLKAEGACFRAMRNAVLQQHAVFYLGETNLSVDAIAAQLGYQDFSSFRRAFKKWTSDSPQVYRARLRS